MCGARRLVVEGRLVEVNQFVHGEHHAKVPEDEGDKHEHGCEGEPLMLVAVGCLHCGCACSSVVNVGHCRWHGLKVVVCQNSEFIGMKNEAIYMKWIIITFPNP